MEGMLNYFLPDDGDSPEHLNVTPLPRVDVLTLGHIKECFPLKGDFHFRFKQAFEGTFVWLDLIEDNDPAPQYNGFIVCKVTRLTKFDDSTNDNIGTASKKKKATPMQGAHEETEKTHEKKVNESGSLIDSDSPGLLPSKSEPAKEKPFNDDLMGLMSDPISPENQNKTNTPPSSTSQPKPADLFNIFDGDNSSSQSSSSSSNPHNFPSNNSRQFPPNMRSQPMASQPQGRTGGGAMNISQMGGPQMAVNQHNPQQRGMQGNFGGLQWQGMGGRGQTPNQTMGGRPMAPGNNSGMQANNMGNMNINNTSNNNNSGMRRNWS